MSNANNKQNETPNITKPLAIVGIGSMFPKAQDVERFWSNIKQGVDAITDIPDSHWSPDDFYDEDQKRPDFTYGNRGGFIDPFKFDPMKYGVPPMALEATDTSQLLGMVVAEEAMDDAGYGLDVEFDRSKVSVILGVTGALEMVIPLGARLGHPQWRKALKAAGLDDATIDDAVERISDTYVEWQENSFPGLLGNVVAGRISKYLDTGGTNCVVDAACASSLSALHLAALELETGKANMVITGGTDTFNDIFMYMCFSKTPALSPTGNSKPFADDCDGTILGEGLGMVVLKRLEDAERDGDQIYAVLKGMGSSSDGKGDAIYAPSSPGQKKALQTAYRDAGVTPDTIELLEAHGTGTKKGDAVEAAALTDVYGSESDKPTWCALGSVKSQIGHTKSAAGAAGMIKAALSLHNKVLPPTIKVDQPAESVAPGNTPFYVNTTKRPWVSNAEHPRRAAISAFGFGGSNFHMVLEEYKAQKARVDWDGKTQIIAFSGSDRKAIEAQVSTFNFNVDWILIRSAAQASRTSFDATAKARLLIVLEDGVTDIEKLTANLADAFAKHDAKEAFVTRDGAYYGYGEAAGQLGYIFPGQGMQFTGMLRDLSCQFPEMLEALEMANEVVGLDDEGQRLSDRIYPHPTFDKDAAKAVEAALTKTNIAQPAIGTVSLGAMNVLKRFGVQAEAAAGHSYGELTALCSAGVLSPEGLVQASKLRGELMASGDGDRGTMLAVRGSLEKTQAIIDEEKLDVIIANKNSPEQGVLSGSTEAIGKAKEVLDAKKVRSVPLPVAAAFHSSLVADAAIPFAEGLADIKFKSAKIPVFSNTTGKPYPKKLDAIRDLLANQLANSVEFVDEITAMYESGVRNFLEVGPGGKMIGLVKAILKGKDDTTFYALDASGGKKSGIADLAKTLAQTAALGYRVELSAWDDSFTAPEDDGKKRMTVELTGANYRSPQSLKKMDRPATPKKAVVAASATPTHAPTPVAEAKVSSAPANSGAVAELMAQTQANIATLQQMQQQTAQLHAQFMQSQEQASKSFAALMQQQQQAFVQTGMVAPTATPNIQPVPMNVSAPVAAPTPAPVQTPTSVAATVPAANGVVKTLLAVVAEKTGYPEDMLEMSMSLDADLGIDSIKRVEILSSLQEQIPSLPTIDADELGSIQTLEHIVEKLGDVGDVSTASSPAVATASNGQVQTKLMEVVSEKTGYPTDMLELSMSLDADLGIDSIKRVEILSALQEAIPELPSVEAEALGALETLSDVVNYLDAHAPVGTPAPVSSAPSVSGDHIQQLLMHIVAEKTGYPTDMLELSMSLDADLGIDSIKRVEILSSLQEAEPSLPTIEAEVLGTLVTLEDVVGHINSVVPSAATAHPAVVSVSGAAVQENLVQIVSEKTGYPTDMLELSMSLDADLGIDSIKRVEILSALQEAMPDLPAVEAEALGVLETLQDVLNYLDAQSPVDSVASVSSVPSADSGAIEVALMSIISEKTGYPTDMLEPAMNLDSDLGIDSIKRVEILSALQEAHPELPAIEADELGNLQTITDVLTTLNKSTASTSASGSPDSKSIAPSTPIPNDAQILRQCVELIDAGDDSPALNVSTGTAWAIVGNKQDPLTQALLAELGSQGFSSSMWNAKEASKALSGVLVVAPELGLDDETLKSMFFDAQAASKALAENAVFATISRMDGQLGLSGNFDGSIGLGGSLSGLSKTASHEWETMTCRALDVARTYTNAEDAAHAVVAELLVDGPLEVGLSPDKRLTTQLKTESIDTDELLTFSSDDVIVISGGARGVTAEVALAIAQAGSPTLVLLGRSDAPASEESWLSGIEDEAAIKKAIMQHATVKLTPKELQGQFDTISRNREMRNFVGSMEAAGSTVLYRAVDIRDAEAVSSVLAEVRSAHGPITGFVHGAGVLADRFIHDKTPEQFDRVYDTKVGGLRALLKATQSDPLKWIALFSSSTGRFGRKGQVDYAMANEVMNKWAHVQRVARPDCKIASVNWGPWAGGMVTPALRKVFESEGIGMIGLHAGAQYLLRELNRPVDGPREIVILGATGNESVAHELPLGVPADQHPTVNMTLNVKDYPFLKSHVIGGKAVLPVAMYVEWFAHTALHANPGFQFVGIDDVRIFKGLRLEENDSTNVTILSGKPEKQNGTHLVHVTLCSGDNSEVMHAKGVVRLGTKFEEPASEIASEELGAYSKLISEVYNGKLLFHGETFQGIEAVDGCSDAGIDVSVHAASEPTQWLTNPLRKKWLSDPLVMDCAFQAMILWAFEAYQAGSLPVSFKRFTQFQSSWPEGMVQVRTRIAQHSAHKATAFIEFVHENSKKLLARIEGYECVIDSSLNEAFLHSDLTQKPLNS